MKEQNNEQPAPDSFEANAVRPATSEVAELVKRTLGENGDPDALATLLAAVNMAVRNNAPVTASNICFDGLQAAFYHSPVYVSAVAEYRALHEERVRALPKHR